MFYEICRKINWSPITSSISSNNNKIKLVDDKKILLKEIIECRRLGHLAISLKLAEHGLKFFPDDPVLLDNIARAYWKLDKYSEAIDLWKKILFTKKSSSNLKKSALNFILKDNNSFVDFIADNVSVAKPMSPVLKKLVDMSIENRKLKKFHQAYAYIENAWLDSFMHPALVDNYARIQFSIGSKFKSIYCFECLAKNTSNDFFKKAAIKFLEQNQAEYLSILTRDIQKICTRFDQSLITFKTIDEFICFVDSRSELGKKVLNPHEFSLLNIELFRYIEQNDIIADSAYEMYFDACLNLSYINEAQNFYSKFNHYFSNKSQAQAKLAKLQSISLPSYIGGLNHQLVELANNEELDLKDLDLSNVKSYSDLEKIFDEFLKTNIIINPFLTLKVFDCFANVGFLTPRSHKYLEPTFSNLDNDREELIYMVDSNNAYST